MYILQVLPGSWHTNETRLKKPTKHLQIHQGTFQKGASYRHTAYTMTNEGFLRREAHSVSRFASNFETAPSMHVQRGMLSLLEQLVHHG